jgi:hypothetical protein
LKRQFVKLECQELLPQILLWLHGLVSAGLRRRGALLPPPPQVPPGGLGTALLHKRVVAGGPWDKLASAKRRQRPATTLPRSVAAASAQRAVPVLGERKLWKFLVYYGEVVPNPILGGHSDGADRASKKATECQLLFFWASVSTFENRLPRNARSPSGVRAFAQGRACCLALKSRGRSSQSDLIGSISSLPRTHVPTSSQWPRRVQISRWFRFL